MYLLDTHTLLWALFKEDSLSVNAKKVIMDDNDIFVSIVSLWEIAIKQSIGKLEIFFYPRIVLKHDSGISLLSFIPVSSDT